jgi:hypothetical protein
MEGMRKGFTLSLLITILFGGGYFYYIAEAVCPVPISYTLGDIDERFNITREEARLSLSEAESVWEDATGRNLFTYEEDGKLTIHFVFDDRQQFINAEGEFKEKLDATENISDAIKDTYANLVEEYTDLKMTYETKVASYEQKLAVYNAEVERYNNQGGAPSDVYESLSEQKRVLNREQASLNELSSSLNELVREINNIGEKGNSLINTYNQGVGVYNETFGESREFTQGDYTGEEINIYTFEDSEELKLVLVHELGHALSLEHVDGEESIMHYLLGGQPESSMLSEYDLAEFDRVCGDKTLWEKIELSFERSFAS